MGCDKLLSWSAYMVVILKKSDWPHRVTIMAVDC